MRLIKPLFKKLILACKVLTEKKTKLFFCVIAKKQIKLIFFFYRNKKYKYLKKKKKKHSFRLFLLLLLLQPLYFTISFNQKEDKKAKTVVYIMVEVMIYRV